MNHYTKVFFSVAILLTSFFSVYTQAQEDTNPANGAIGLQATIEHMGIPITIFKPTKGEGRNVYLLSGDVSISNLIPLSSSENKGQYAVSSPEWGATFVKTMLLDQHHRKPMKKGDITLRSEWAVADFLHKQIITATGIDYMDSIKIVEISFAPVIQLGENQDHLLVVPKVSNAFALSNFGETQRTEIKGVEQISEATNSWKVECSYHGPRITFAAGVNGLRGAFSSLEVNGGLVVPDDTKRKFREWYAELEYNLLDMKNGNLCANAKASTMRYKSNTDIIEIEKSNLIQIGIKFEIEHGNRLERLDEQVKDPEAYDHKEYLEYAKSQLVYWTQDTQFARAKIDTWRDQAVCKTKRKKEINCFGLKDLESLYTNALDLHDYYFDAYKELTDEKHDNIEAWIMLMDDFDALMRRAQTE